MNKNTETSPGKVAQGYNPGRVTEEQLGAGFRLVPKKYIGDWLLKDNAAEAWAVGGHVWLPASVIGVVYAGAAYPVSLSHRTTLTNAQLGALKTGKGLRNYRYLTQTEVEDFINKGYRQGAFIEWFANPTGEWRAKGTCNFDKGLRYRTLLSAAELAAEALARTAVPVTPNWRRISDTERALLFKNERHGNTDHFCFIHHGRRIPGSREPSRWLVGNRYETTLSEADLATWAKTGRLPSPEAKPEPVGLVWRTITEDEREALRTWRKRVGKSVAAPITKTKFRCCMERGTDWWFNVPGLGYQTTLTEEEVVALTGLLAVWRPLTESERAALNTWRRNDLVGTRDKVDWAKFRLDYVEAEGANTYCFRFNEEPASRYETTYTEAEVAEVTKLAEPVWRKLTEAERAAAAALFSVREGALDWDWTKFRHDGNTVITGLSFDSLVAREAYETCLTEAEFALLLKPVWRKLTGVEQAALATRARKVDTARLRLARAPGLNWEWGFPNAGSCETTYTTAELEALFEVQ